MSVLSRFLTPEPFRQKGRTIATVATVATVEPAAFRLWHIRHPDGQVSEHSFTPPATRAEVSARYPDAEIQPMDDADDCDGSSQAFP